MPPPTPSLTLLANNDTQAKKYDRAIAILARHAWWDKLIHVVRALEKSDTRCLGMCATHFKRANQYQASQGAGRGTQPEIGGRGG